MRATRRGSFEFLSMSALDLFASALGVFVLVTIAMFPYYLRQPSTEAALEGARADLEAAADAVVEAKNRIDETEANQIAAAAALEAAEQRLASAEAQARAIEEARKKAAEARALIVDERAGTRGPGDAVLAINDLDLVFVMDTTGSMGDELLQLRRDLIGILEILHRLSPRLRVGFVAMKDYDAAFITRSFPLTPVTRANVLELQRFVGSLDAAGGGDFPEPVDEALRVAVEMDWRADAQGRILVIGDAPARSADWSKATTLARTFRQSASTPDRPRAVSTILTGTSPPARTFFEELAAAGGGKFTTERGPMIENVLVSVLRDPSERPDE